MRERLHALRPWAKRELPTYEERRDFFQKLVAEALAMSVAIVGAGPGDPGLITVRGAGARARAGVLVYDRLVSLELVARPLVRRGSRATVSPRRRSNELLVHHGRRAGGSCG